MWHADRHRSRADVAHNAAAAAAGVAAGVGVVAAPEVIHRIATHLARRFRRLVAPGAHDDVLRSIASASTPEELERDVETLVQSLSADDVKWQDDMEEQFAIWAARTVRDKKVLEVVQAILHTKHDHADAQDRPGDAAMDMYFVLAYDNALKESTLSFEKFTLTDRIAALEALRSAVAANTIDDNDTTDVAQKITTAIRTLQHSHDDRPPTEDAHAAHAA